MPAAHRLEVGRSIATATWFPATMPDGSTWSVDAGTSLTLTARGKDGTIRVRVRWPTGDREWWMSAAELARVTATTEER